MEGILNTGSTADISKRRGRVLTTPNSCFRVIGIARSVRWTRHRSMEPMDAVSLPAESLFSAHWPWPPPAPTSCSTGNVLRRPKGEAGHSSPCIFQVQDEWSHTTTPYALTARTEIMILCFFLEISGSVTDYKYVFAVFLRPQYMKCRVKRKEQQKCPSQCHEGIRVSQLILNLGSRWWLVANFTPWPRGELTF